MKMDMNAMRSEANLKERKICIGTEEGEYLIF